MSATLNVKSSFSIVVNGKTIEGWQGTSSTTDADTAFAITVDGDFKDGGNTIPNDTVYKIWDALTEQDNFDYLFVVADRDCYLQVVTLTSNIQFQLLAGVPFVLGSDDILCSDSSTTALVGGAAPSFELIKTVYLSNNTGQTANYSAFTVT